MLLLPTHWFPSFYDVRYVGYASFLGAFLILFLPAMIRVAQYVPNAHKKNQAVDSFEFFISFTFMGNALGDLGLYQLYRIGFEFDKLLHFVIPGIAIYMLTILFYHRFEMQYSYALLAALLLTIFGSVTWELYEYASDYFFRTHIFGVDGFDVTNDTAFDLLFDIGGTTGGAIFSLLREYQNRPKPRLAVDRVTELYDTK